MEHPVAVTVHPSCFPERTRAAYLESFRTRRMNHRFHYESEKQAQRWLAIHEAYSPARTDDDCLQTYNRALAEIGAKISSDSVALVSIGCGGGQKDAMLLKHISANNRAYIPTDVSLPLVLTARKYAPASKPALLDLPGARDLASFMDSLVSPDAERVVAFFGMLPNFEPDEALPILASALRPRELLVASANLSPGADYLQGVKKILPLYDNIPTRGWLATSLSDAGLEVAPSDIEFSIAELHGFLRIEANYRFKTSQRVQIGAEQFTYSSGETFRLFYSYRHTPRNLQELFRKYDLEITNEWNTESGEEGVFLVQKS